MDVVCWGRADRWFCRVDGHYALNAKTTAIGNLFQHRTDKIILIAAAAVLFDVCVDAVVVFHFQRFWGCIGSYAISVELEANIALTFAHSLAISFHHFAKGSCSLQFENEFIILVVPSLIRNKFVHTGNILTPPVTLILIVESCSAALGSAFAPGSAFAAGTSVIYTVSCN
jgi:hypothetical protein